MIKIKYKGIKIKTDNIDEAIAILESLKVQPPFQVYPPIPPDPYVPQDWKITCSGTVIIDSPTVNGDSPTVTSN